MMKLRVEQWSARCKRVSIERSELKSAEIKLGGNRRAGVQCSQIVNPPGKPIGWPGERTQA